MASVSSFYTSFAALFSFLNGFLRYQWVLFDGFSFSFYNLLGVVCLIGAVKYLLTIIFGNDPFFDWWV